MIFFIIINTTLDGNDAGWFIYTAVARLGVLLIANFL